MCWVEIKLPVELEKLERNFSEHVPFIEDGHESQLDMKESVEFMRIYTL